MEISGGGCPAISTRPALQVATAEGSEIVLTNPSEEWRGVMDDFRTLAY
jgi:hypothetical protein